MDRQRLKSRRLPAWPLWIAVLAPGAAAAADDEKTWTAEVGTSVAHHDNFFFRRESPMTDAPSATLTRAFATGEREYEAYGMDWTLFGEAAATFVSGVDDADYQELGLGLRGKRGSWRAEVEAKFQPNRLYSEEGLGTFYDLSAVTLQGRYALPGDMWLALAYERKRWEFDSLDQARDADGNEFTATLRFPVSERAALRVFGMIADKDARGPENSWEATGLGIALELSPAERWSVFARLRSRDREYDDAPIGDSNFERDDTILDGLVNARYRMGQNWGLGGQVEFRDGDSSRLDRNYDALVFSVSAYLSF